ncbi:unnamed protein product [Parajaminaea phylloscopi]
MARSPHAPTPSSTPSPSETGNAYEHTPFPDVSGLRSSVPERHGRLVIGFESPAGIFASEVQDCPLVETCESLIGAVWATLLIHYIPQESLDLAFVVGPDRVVRLRSSAAPSWSVAELSGLIASQVSQQCSKIEQDGLSSVAWMASPKASMPDDDEPAHEMLLQVSCCQRGILSYQLDSSAAVHSEESARILLVQFDSLLHSFLTNHELPAFSCDRLPAALRAGDNPLPQTISLSDDSSLRNELFHYQFQRLAQQGDGAIALDFRFDLTVPSGIHPNIAWTYQELLRRASLLAQRIRSSTVPRPGLSEGTDDVVALCLPKSPESYVAQLATLIAGAAWCPIDIDWPDERKKALLEKSGADVVLTLCSRTSMGSYLPDGMHVIALNEMDWKHTPAEAKTSEHFVEFTADRLAYKIWTSGTTGLPKAVGIEHRAAVQALRALQEAIPHRGHKIRYLQFSAYVFDLSILDCFYTWGLGGTLCACPRETLLTDLIGVANAFAATHTLLTPAVMAMTPRAAIPSLQVVINGGEKLTQVVADTWSADCCLLNLYGPAEATLIAMHRRVPPEDVFKAPNIGRALPTVSCHALNKRGDIVPKGAIGELALGGYQCARGYIGDGTKTRDKFVHHATLGRIYMTGDLVRQLADETFEYLGRQDDQIKVNGIRIETLEISAVIRASHDSVLDSETMALTLDSQSEDEQARIVNFSVLPHLDTDPEHITDNLLRLDQVAASVARDLRASAQRSLPAYMVPSLFVILTQFPRTTSAKIDRVALRKALRSLDIQQWEAKISETSLDVSCDDDNDDETFAPVESELRHAISKLCGLRESQIGRHTPLPSLGLDSIRAMSLARILHQAGRPTSVVDIVTHASLAALAKQIGEKDFKSQKQDSSGQVSSQYLTAFDARYRSHVAAAAGLDDSEIAQVLPTTPLQQGMLAETLRDPDQRAYWLNRDYVLSCDLTLQGCQEVIERYIAVNPAFRTAFTETGKLKVPNSQQSAESLPPFMQIVRTNAMPSVFVAEGEGTLAIQEARARTGTDPLNGRPPVVILLYEDVTKHLLLRMHHSLYDARTLEILCEDICVVLSGGQSAVRHGIAAALPKILHFAEADQQKQEEVWAQCLSPFPKGHAVAFPSLGSTIAPLQHRTSFGRISRKASIGWTTIAQSAMDRHTSVRPLAQGAWASVLGAYLETDWIMLGDSVSGRTVAPGLDDILGPLHATLPVAIHITPSITQQGLIRQIDKFHKEVVAHQHVPLTFVRKFVQATPSTSLFQSIFVMETSSSESHQASPTGPSLHLNADLDTFVEHPLAVELLRKGDNTVELGLVWRRDVMDVAHAELLLDQFEAVLQSFCGSKDLKAQDWLLQRLPTRMLSVSNCVPSDGLIAETALNHPVESWLAQNAEACGDRVAVEIWSTFNAEKSSASQRLTYLQLSTQANQLASLMAQQLPPRSVVAVCLRRSLLSYVALLAIQISGNTYLPIDEGLPRERQRLLIEDGGAACVIVDSISRPRFESTLQRAVIWCCDDDSFADRLSRADSRIDTHTKNPDDVAYILYTSGTTGVPKGCKITRRNLSAAIEAFRWTLEDNAPGSLNQEVRFLARSAEAFDVALLETFLPLRVGGTIVTGHREDILANLRAAMVSTKVTHAAVVPSLFSADGQRISPADVPGIRTLIVGGEPLSSDIAQLWGRGEVPLLNAYGPTETTIGNSMGRIGSDSSPKNIGRPFPGTRYLVAKEGTNTTDLRLTLRGEPGELCIAGAQTGAGYVKDPAASGFTTHDGERLYRTGDIVRMTAGGEVIYLGRRDDSQVKIRGARLELKEIDAVLTQGPQGASLQGVSLLADTKADDQEQKEIVCFVAARAMMASTEQLAVDQTVTSEVLELRRHLRNSLPSHMVPSHIVPLTFLPLANVSGKIDRKGLLRAYEHNLREKAMILTRNDQSRPHRPLLGREKIFVDELRQVLRNQISADIDPGEDLFSLGLDSLTAITLVGRLRRRGITISVPVLMEHSVIEDAVKHCDYDGSPASDPQPVHEDAHMLQQWLQRAKNAGLEAASLVGVKVLPCSPLQQGLLTQTLASAEDLYISQLNMLLRDDVDTERLRSAVDAVVVRHPIWRTAFGEVEGAFWQLVHPASRRPRWVSNETELESLQLTRDLATEPPIRFYISEKGLQKKLIIKGHHALYDGATIDNLQQEVNSIYHGASLQEVPSFSEAIRRSGPHDAKGGKDFWTNAMKDFTITPFPNLTQFHLEPSEDRQEVAMVATMDYRALAQAARKFAATPQALVVAAFCTVFTQMTGEEDSIFGLILSGRTIPLDDIDKVHGPLISTVPFRTDRVMPASDRSANGVRAVHDQIIAAQSHQDVSLLDLRRWLELEQPMFNTLFSFLPPQRKDISSERSIFVSAESDMSTEYSVAMEVQPLADDSLRLRLVYDPHLLQAEQSSLLLQQLNHEIRRLVAPATHLTPSSELLSIVGTKYSADSVSRSFLEQFQEQVRSKPQAVAVDFASRGLTERFESLTFDELDRRSSHIASHLCLLNDRIIGLCMERSLDFYASLVAIWKAGKTYLPLDPLLPLDRLQLMLTTVDTQTVLTDRLNLSKVKSLANQPLALESLTDLALAGSRNQTEVTMSAVSQKAAYILFTSGSTGQPKAVPISHLALAAALLSWKEMLPHKQDSRMLQFASCSFDVSLIEICMPLAFGFTVVSAPKDILLEDLEETFRCLKLTMADLPATLAPTIRPGNVPKLEWLMSGGDAIDERVIREWAPHGLINAWGPTETTIGNTLGFVKPNSKRSIVGKAYPTSSVYVLKAQAAEVVYRGAAGELAVGGPQLAQGYLGRPDLTSLAFVHLCDGTLVYRTGDRGRVLADGTVEVLGRISRGQVKLRGQRLELDEVSHAFRTHALINDADTLYVQHPAMPAKQLVTWLSLQENAGLPPAPILPQDDEKAAQAIRESIENASKLLPSYMLPSHVLVARGPLPLTPNNKVDHKSLEASFVKIDISVLQRLGDRVNTDSADDSSWTEAEVLIRQVIAGFCQCPVNEISRTTSFYRLGIDSLSALRLAHQIRKAGLHHLTARDILRWPNVALLSAHLSKVGPPHETIRTQREELEQVARRAFDPTALSNESLNSLLSVLPCSPLQTALIVQSIASNGNLYIHHHLFTVHPSVTSTQLSAAWTSLVASVEILRTSFHPGRDGSSWYQCVHRHLEHSSIFEVYEMPLADAWPQIAQPLSDTELSLAQPLAKLSCVVSAQQTYVVLRLHHAQYDGATIPQLMDDFQTILSSGAVPERRPFGDLLPRLISRPADVEFWTTHLVGWSGSVALQNGPTDDNNDAMCEATLKMSIPATTATACAQEHAISLRAAATLALAKLVGSRQGTRDVVVGQIFSLRDESPHGERVLGPAFNTLPVRVNLVSKMSNAAALILLQRELDRSRDHRSASLRDVVRQNGWLEAPFEVVMDYQVVPATSSTSGQPLFKPAQPPRQPGATESTLQYSLNIEFRQGEHDFELFATAKRSRFSEAELQAFLRDLNEGFTETLRNPERPSDALVSRLPEQVLSDGLSAELLASSEQSGPEDWSDTERAILRIVLIVTKARAETIRPWTALTTLGLDSIGAMRLAALSRKEDAAIRFSVVDIAKGRSIRGISRGLTAKSAITTAANGRSTSKPSQDGPDRAAAARTLGVAVTDVEEVLPALPGQVFHLASWVASAGRLGIHSFAWQSQHQVLAGNRLGRAWAALRHKHPILRTAFLVSASRVYQAVFTVDACNDNIETMQLSDEVDYGSAVRGRLRQLHKQSPDWSRPQARLLLLSKAHSSVIVLHLPHALYDAWSIEMLYQDLQELYAGVQLTCLARPSFLDYVKRVHSDQRVTQQSSRNFWRNELQHAVPTTVLSQSALKPHKGDSVRDVVLMRPDASKLPVHGTTKIGDIPLQYIFLASWAQELRILAGARQSVTFGLYTAGRSGDFEGIEDMAGPCMNVLPVEVNAGQDRSLYALARDLQDSVQRRIPHEQADPIDIRRWTGLENEVLYDAFVNLLWTRGPSHVSGGPDRELLEARDVQTWPALDIGHVNDLLPGIGEQGLTESPAGAGAGPAVSLPLSASTLAAYGRRALDVDIFLSEDGGHVGIAVRCDSKVMDMGGANELVDSLVRRVADVCA